MNQPSATDSVTNHANLIDYLVLQGTSERQSAPASVAAEATSISLEDVQQKLETILQSVDPQTDVIGRLVEFTGRMTRAIWCGQFQQSREQILTCVAEYNGIEGQNLGLNKSSVLPTAGSAIKSNKSRISTSGDLTVIATPVFFRQARTGPVDQCLCLALNLRGISAEPFLLALQLVATYIGRWHDCEMARQLDWQVDATAAIAELNSEICACNDPGHAAVLATNRLARFLGASAVAIGYCRRTNSKQTRIASISGATEVDSEGDVAREIESALNETLLRNSVTTLPDGSSDDRSMKLAHRKLIEAHPDSHLVSAPLTTSEGKTIGAWLCLFPSGDRQGRMIRFAEVASQHLAAALDVSARAAAGPVTRLRQQAVQWAGGKVGKILLMAMFFVALLMAVPVPHRIECGCVIKPVVRRFAVAPHDGILLESLVKPGDIVSAGQIVARLDDRELRLEQAELIAQREAVIKQRDVNRSARNAAETKISEYEIEKLDAKIQLVQYRLENLEIQSEVDGVVLRSDLEEARGAPVQRGDVIVEISPLKQLKLEVDIHEADVAYVKGGQSATIVLDGCPFCKFTEYIESVHPMSEIRNRQNVFVAEVNITHHDDRLRPGMQGRVKVNEGLRPIGWILFHRPLQRVYSLFL
jgi:multidrug efflux pump subunit AcrA (membrane-fusion protein)